MKNIPASVQEDLRIQEAYAARQNANKKYTKDGKLILDPNVYGPSKATLAAPAINMEEELDLFRAANIIDEESKQYFMGNTNMPKQNKKPVQNKVTPEPIIQETQMEEELKKEEVESNEFTCPHCNGTGVIVKDKELTDEEKYELVYNDLTFRFGIAPDIALLKSWKKMHGAIFLMDLGDEVYIYRYLKRIEYKELISSEWTKWDEFRQQEFVAEKCLLWPQLTPEKKATMPAGTLEQIAAQVNIQSMFLDPSVVASRTMKI